MILLYVFLAWLPYAALFWLSTAPGLTKDEGRARMGQTRRTNFTVYLNACYKLRYYYYNYL